MRKLSSLIVVALLTLAGSARAQEEAPAAAPAGDAAAPAGDSAAAAPAPAAAPAAAAQDSKLQVGINFLPMFLGKFSASAGGQTVDMDAKIAYGVGITAGYNVIPGLSVGIAPQMLFNLKPKDGDASAAKELDLFARVAYTYKVIPDLGIYAEFLPGYSVIFPPSGNDMNKPKGLVLAFGVGATYDINQQIYANLGVGYQLGFQKASQNGADFDYKTKFLRVAVGVGVKF